MGRARRARKIAADRGLRRAAGSPRASARSGALGYGVLKAEAQVARRIVGQPFDGSPDDNGTYGAGAGRARRARSSSATPPPPAWAPTTAPDRRRDHRHGVSRAHRPPGPPHQRRGRRRRVLGTSSSSSPTRSTRCPRPHVAIIMIGANDVTHRIDKAIAVRHLETAVRALRAARHRGRRRHLPRPRHHPAGRPAAAAASAAAGRRDLAAAQTVAVVEAGGRTVSLGDLLGPEFAERPHEMFSADRFHPSPAGYARAAAALLPQRLRRPRRLVRRATTPTAAPDTRRGEGVGPVAVAADVCRPRPRHRGQRHPDRRPEPRPARPLGGAAAPPARRRCPTATRATWPTGRPTAAMLPDALRRLPSARGREHHHGESNATPADPATRHTIEAD